MSEKFDALNETHPAGEGVKPSPDYKDQVVMESLGGVDPSSAEYVEADDELDAIAEGFK